MPRVSVYYKSQPVQQDGFEKVDLHGGDENIRNKNRNLVV